MTQKPSGARFLAKVIPMLVMLFVLAILAVPLHEAAHQLVGNTLSSTQGYVIFTWAGGMYYQFPLTPLQDFLTRIAGGLFQALLFGIAWGMSAWQARYSKWELDTCAVFGMLTVGYFVYAWFDGLGAWIDYGALIGIVAAIAVCGVLYGKKLLSWIFELDGSTPAANKGIT